MRPEGAGRLVDGLAAAFLALVLVWAGRQICVDETASGAVLAAAALLLAVVWLRRRRPAPREVVLGLGAAFAVWSSGLIAMSSTRAPDGRLYFCLFDDAFVSLRYGWNLAHGRGLVWNPGERVEGFTNPLTTLLMALPSAVLDRSRAALAVQLLGVATVLAIALLSYRLALRLGLRAPALAYLLVLACYPLAYWSILGMETGLVALLLVAATLVAVGERDGADWRVAVLLGLAVTARPDALVSALAVLGWRALCRRRAWRAGLAEAALFLAFPAAVLALRWLYYGALVPNTYVLKVAGLPLSFRLRLGTQAVLHYVGWLTPAIALAVASVGRADDRRRRLLLLAVWGSSIAATLFVGGDAWPRWRFLCPTLPMLLLLAADGAAQLARRLRRPALAWVLAGLVIVAQDASFGPEVWLAREAFGIPEVKQQVEVAVLLSRLCTPQASVGVFHAGTVPYYTGLRGIDFLGKTDPHVARAAPNLRGRPGHNKTDLAFSIGARRPDYVEGFRWGADQAPSDDYEPVGPLWLRRGSPNVRWDLVRGGPGATSP
ncbi:MAG TPA: hypothetical protein VMX54_08650 [Vicinamibacteria bacterium]|nr:hypothetical protein [Vicinamibacteria bacterium]